MYFGWESGKLWREMQYNKDKSRYNQLYTGLFCLYFQWFSGFCPFASSLVSIDNVYSQQKCVASPARPISRESKQGFTNKNIACEGQWCSS